MAWTTEELSESKPLPLLKLEKDKPVRIRILAPQIAPAISADSIYAKGTWDKAKHFPPDEVKLVIGARPVDCIGIRNACIFHEGLLSWDTTYDNLINVVVYEGVSPREKTFTDSFILGLNMKLSLWKNMGEQLALLGFEKNQLWAVDWIIVKTGDGQYNTKYNCTAIPDTLEPEIDLVQFPAQEEYADIEVPAIIDFRKFYPNVLTTPQQQEEWYNNAQAKAAQKSPQEYAAAAQQSTVAHAVMPALNSGQQLMGIPPAMRNVTQVPAPQQITMQSGGEAPKRRGRPPGSTNNTKIPVAQLNPVITQMPQMVTVAQLRTGTIPPAIAPVAPPVIKTIDPSQAYNDACLLVDPWGQTLKDSQYIEFIVNADAAQQQEYVLTPEIVAAAKLVKAGPPIPPAETAVQIVKPSLPKLPGQGLITPVVTSVAPAGEVSELDNLRGQLTKQLMSLPVFKNPANIMQFLKLFFPDGTIRTVRQITDTNALNQILEYTVQGNEAVAQLLGLPA